ncbi:MAG: hypothetical protein HYY84_20625 [Deltaproteobacteria bacterium]|nr:hypothetical protein [Deltaproteobacteria bacterium]
MVFVVLSGALPFACGPSDMGGDIDEENVFDVATEASASDDKADHAGAIRVTLGTSTSLRAGKRGTVRFDVRDAAGAAVTKYDVEHTKLFHLIIVARDLSYFTHIHPTHNGKGRFSVSWTPAAKGDDYHLFAQFKPTGAALRTLKFDLKISGDTTRAPTPIAADTSSMVVNGKNMLMGQAPSGGYRVGAQKVQFMVHDAQTGALATNLGTFLGAKAHIIAIKANAQGSVFRHGHDMGSAGSGGGGHGGHGGHGGSTSGAATATNGMLSFDINFPSPGIYRLWVQYRRGSSNVTQFVTLSVRP